MSSTFELTVSRIIPASRKEVFEAWLSPDAPRRVQDHQTLRAARLHVGLGTLDSRQPRNDRLQRKES